MGKNKEIIDKIVSLCEQKNYKKELAFNLVLICCSAQMEESGYTVEDAINKAIEYINEGEDVNEVIYKLLKLSSFED